MKKLITIMTTAAAIALASPMIASATEYTKGVIEKIDMKQKKVTIKHEELANLDMPAMTMVFRTADDKMLENMKQGQEIEFVAEKVQGRLVVVKVK